VGVDVGVSVCVCMCVCVDGYVVAWGSSCQYAKRGFLTGQDEISNEFHTTVRTHTNTHMHALSQGVSTQAHRV